MEIQRERPLRILAADDSAVMRGILRELFVMRDEDRLSDLPPMELCGLARDGVECLEAVKLLRPDMLVLDLEMPRMNGLEVLERLRRENPDLPVIMCSAYTERGARSTLEALACGASDYVMKPYEQRDFTAALVSLSQQLLPRIAALAREMSPREEGAAPVVSGGGEQRSREAYVQFQSLVEVVVIGLSTGGPSALEQLLPQLPADFPVPVLIVQHMPKVFTAALAERLDKCCALHVEQAYDSAPLRAGTVWLAPGGSHMEVALRAVMSSDGERSGRVREGRVRLHQQELLNHCRPSVDYLFHSAARMYGAGTLALVMTGMGADGLNGARAVHERGGVVLAQDEATSAVWGMPGRVTEAGIASATLPLSAIATALRRRVDAGRAVKPELVREGTVVAASRVEVMHGLL
jgi:two-component system, chemotaxis family, protein-glutamate methylesterase/glutaminase